MKDHLRTCLTIMVLLIFLTPLINPSAANVQSHKTPHEDYKVYITSDNIGNTVTDNNLINNIKQELAIKGINAVNYGIGPNKHIEVLQDKNVPVNAVIVNIYGGACAGTLYEMGEAWYMGLKGDRKVLTIFWAHTSTNITGLEYLPRAHDDNFDSPSFKGLAYPDKYLEKNGYSYIYSSDTNTIAAAIANLNNENKLIAHSLQGIKEKEKKGAKWLYQEFREKLIQLRIIFKEKKKKLLEWLKYH